MFGIRGHKTEHIMESAGNFRIRSQQTEIGVDPRRGCVVIPRSQMRVAPRYTVRVAPYKERELAVGLQSHKPVKYLDSGIFQLARPTDVGGFIEAGFQFH